MRKIVSKGQVFFILFTLAVLLSIGTFFDYQISLKLFNKHSLFGNFFAAYGQLPTAIAFVASGYLLISSRMSNKRINSILSMIFGLLFSSLGYIMMILEPIMYIQMHVILSVILATAMVISTIYLLNILTSNMRQSALKKLAFFLIFIVLGQVFIINIIKIPWGRPRMRLISSDSRIPFVSWYEPQTALRNTFVSLGIKGEEFKSFPSGHAGASFNILFITLIPYIKSKFESLSGASIYIAFGFGLIVSLSRIIVGAHFLSDVVVGLGISFIVYLIAIKLLYNNNPNNVLS